jgi:GNAT superfamily N-acetyltransferase
VSHAPYRVAPLADAHDRGAFTSGSELLDRYFHTQVTQDIRRRVTACYVALTEEQRVAGYYTLAAASVLLTDLSPEIQKKLPRYPSVPTVLMGRLAVDRTFRGQGLGGALLADALYRSAHTGIGAYAMLVDAKDEKAVEFYRHHGFIALPDSPQRLFLPLGVVPGQKR